MSANPSRRPYLAVGAVALVLDLVSKEWVFHAVPLHEHRSVIAGFFEIYPCFNDKGPWSSGGAIPEGFRPYFWPVLGVVAMAVIGWSLWTTPPSERLRSHGFALILGGAVGNFVDRILALMDPLHGGVRDFLYFPTIVFGRDFPAFNLADTWLTIGVALVGWTIVQEWREAPAAGAAPAGGAAPATGAPPASSGEQGP